MRKFYPFVKLLQLTARSLGSRLTLIFLVGLLAFSANAQTVRYVNASAAAGGTGASWATAYNDLQAALDVAVSGDEIRVAKGTYKPSKDITGSTTPADLGTRTFLLKNGVKLYGGYDAATGTRNVTANLTILSGDYSNNDKDDFTGFGENAYHVVVANGLTTATELDGFTIKGGDATRSSATFIGLTSGHYYGGGLLCNASNNKLSVSNCRFTKNRASSGGGIYNDRSIANIRNCIIDNNQGSYGSGIYNNSGSDAMTISNSVIANNGLAMTGGGLYNSGYNLFIVNTTIFGNKAQSGGGGIAHPFSSSYTTIRNSIIWGNAGGTINGSGGMYVTASTIEGGGYGSGNLNVDPGFNRITDLDGADDIWGTADDGLHLRTGSLATDKGINTDAAGIATDIAGATRIQGTAVNLGAYETLKTPLTKLYVNASAAAGGDGSSWANAFNNLQDAIDYAVNGDEIWVAKGTYKPTKDATGNATPAEPRTKTFLLKDGVKVYGGFAGTETVLSARNMKLNKTVLSGDLGTVGSSTDNSYHVVAAYAVSATTALDGFIVTDGNATSSTTFLTETNGNNFGGGLFLRSSFLVVTNCFFVNNYATSNGSGIVSFYGKPQFINSVFSGNSGLATIRSYSAAMTLTNCTVAGNSSYYGISAYASTSLEQPTIKNSIIWGSIDASMITFSHSNVMANTVPGGTGNSIVNAAFFKLSDPDGPDNIWGTADDGLVLRAGSPGTNKGNDADVPTDITTDIIGDSRKQGVVNMGAYETLSAPVTIYVNGSIATAGDGSSWASAFKDLQSALEVSGVGDQIWVAKGTYKPTKNVDGNASPYDPRTKTFLLRNGVKLYGGFAGTETTLGARNSTLNKTILSGDLNGNDLAGWVNYSDNSYHVVAAHALTTETVIDGFTITSGNANNADQFIAFGYYNDQGAGIFTLNTGTNLTISNNVIIGNQADKIGGGIYVDQNSPTTIVNCVVANNRITSSTWWGGGVFLSAAAKLINCVFTGNTAYNGAAIYAQKDASIINCTITGNGNSSGGSGAGIYNSGANLVITNTISWANTGFGSTTDGFYSSGGSPVITYSNIHHFSTGYVYPGTGNKNGDPLFVNSADPDGADNTWGTADDGLRLFNTSPSADNGNNAAVSGITTDITGATRIQGTSVNMGAYETTKAIATYVNASATGANDGSSWANAFTSLQSALDAVVSGDKIFVAAGTYKPSVDPDGTSTARKRTFLLKSGVELYGGYNASTGVRDVKANKTILSGDFNGDDVGFSNNTENAYHVVAAKNLSAATLLDGFTISGGNANSSTSFLVEGYNNSGGAIYVYQGSTNLTINNCLIAGNAQAAGALYIRYGSPKVTNCVFTGNSSNSGGAAYNTDGAPSYINCLFVGNSTLSYGGSAMHNSWATTSLVNCTMYGNSTSSSDGGTIYSNNSSNITITNSIIWGNTAAVAGREGVVNSTSTGAYATISYSNVQGYLGGTGNVSGDPLFVNTADPDGADNTWGTADDGLRLVSTSPSTDKGNNTAVAGVTTDITGATRIQNGTVNMGAFEVVMLGQAITGLPATATKTYGDAAYTLSATGGASGNPIVYASSNTAVATISGNTVTIVGAGTVTITANQAGNATYAAAAEVAQTLTVNKRAITVKADALSKVYGDADPALTYTITAGSLAGTDKFTGSLDRATGENGGTSYAINKGTLALSSNYDLTFVSEWFTINKRAITVTADAKSKTYGDADPAFTYTLTSGTLKSGDAFTGSLTRVAGTNAGTYAINQGSLAVNSNYTITFVSKDLTINKRAVTVTANAHSKVYGNADPTFTYTTSPALLSGDVFSGSLGRAAGESVGAYGITIGTLNNNNYAITFVSSNLIIGTRTVTVTADAVSKVYGAADPSLTYTITSGSLRSGDNFTGSLVRATGEDAGTYTINQGTLALNSNYTLSYVSSSLTISKRAVSVAASAQNKGYGDADPVLTYVISSGSLKSGDAFTGTLSRAAGENAGTYAINQGSLALNSNYNLTFTGNTLTINKRVITVTADAVSKTYGDADPALTYKITTGTLKSGDTFTGALSRAVGEDVNTYVISQNTLTINGNYSIVFEANNLTINKRTIAIKADAKGKTYGDADPALTYTLTSGSLKAGDAFTGSLARATGETVGVYAINQGTLAVNSNYTINYTGASLTIDKKTITVTADAVSKVYGEADPSLTYKVPAGSLVGSDALSGTLIRSVGENVGTYTINLGTLANSNYNLNYVSAKLTIGTRSITIKANDASKSVSQTKTFAGTEYTITSGSLASGDAITGVTLNSSGAASGAAVGTYTIVPSAATGISATNYAITYVNGTLTVTAKPVLTVKAADASKVYGEANPAFTYTITGFVDGDNQSTATTGAPALTTSVTTTSAAGPYSGGITAAIGTLASSKYEFSFVNGSFTVNKRAITVTADAQTKEYGDADPALTYKVTSGTIVSGDAFTGDLSRAAGDGIGTYAIDKGTLDIGSNYTVTFVANNLTVGKRNVTVTADAQSKVYGGLDPTLTYKVSSGSLKSGDAFTGTLSRVAGEDAGNYAIEQGTLALNSNYNLTFVSKNLTIGKRFITITADAVSKIYGDTDPALTYKVTSGVLKTGDVLSGSLSRATGENVGTYAIAAGSVANANYDITFVGNDLTINKRTITVAADAKAKVYGDADPAFTYKLTAGTLKTGDALTGGLSRSAGENVGTYAIGKGSLNNSNYDITFVTNNLTINKKAVTVTANAQSKVYGDTDPVLTYTTSPALVGSDAFTGSLVRAAGENAGTYAISIGTMSASSNYEVSFVTNNLTIGKRAITLKADAVSKTYGEADPGLTYALTSGTILSGDAFTGNLERVAGENAGTYAINQGTLVVNSNYQLTFVSDNFTIGKRAITVTADAVSKVYGDADPALTYAITAGTLVGADALTGSLARATGEDAGSYSIDIGTLNNTNYNITFVSSDFTINKRAITVTADALSKVYGEADPAITYAITSGTLVGSDVLSGSLSRTAGEDVGSYAINKGSLDNSNYTITFVGDNLTILPRAITLKANDASKIEGQTLTFAGNEYSLTTGSLAAGDAITSVSLSSPGAVASAAVGTYEIVPSAVAGISTTNYTITYANGTLTVNACMATTITTQPIAQAKCAGETVTFEVVASGTRLTYQWKKGSETIDGATGATFTITGITAANAGDYSVVVTGACGKVTSNVASLTVNTVAVPTITASGNTLTSSATTGNQWYREGVEIVGATAQTYQVQAAGRYTVKVTSGSCSAMSSEFNFVPTRIDGPNAWSGEVVAYPNPVSKVLYVKNNSGRKLQLQLVDVAGVKVRTSTMAGTQASINVEGLAAGSYFLVITDQQTQQSISINLIKL